MVQQKKSAQLMNITKAFEPGKIIASNVLLPF
jgi:hypothetical protein